MTGANSVHLLPDLTDNQAGWAEIDITPPLGLPMGGRGPRFTPGASVLDPLFAQALILEDSTGQRTLWLSLDLIGMSADVTTSLRYEIAARTGIPYENIILNFSHPHSGPMVNFDKYPVRIPKPVGLQAYESDLRKKLLDAAYAAAAALQPVTITEHWGVSDVGVNRRARNTEGTMTMAPNPDGTYNRDLWILDIATPDGTERCLVFSYGCHPVIAYGFCRDGISADYPGVCRRQLQEKLGAHIHCQFIQGLAGNVRPRVLGNMNAGRFRKATPDDLEQAGTQLANDVVTALDTAGEKLTLSLRAVSGWFQARRDLAQIPTPSHWQSLTERDDELSRNVGTYWLERMRDNTSLTQAVPVEIGLLQLSSDRLIAWLSNEAVAEWLSLLQVALDIRHLVVWGYCQHISCYLPTDALLREGGYEVIDSNRYDIHGPGPFALGLNDAALRRFRGLAQQVF